MEKKVVITGLGAITPLGNTVQEFWDNVIEGNSGIDTLTKCAPWEKGIPAYIAGEIKNLDMNLFLDKKNIRRNDPFTWYGVAAAHEAIKDAQLLNNDNVDKERIGVVVGSGVGGIHGFQENVKLMQKDMRISPFLIPQVITDTPSGLISIIHGFMGPNFSVSTACATANHSILNSFYTIQRGEADIMITGGCEGTLSDLTIGGFASAQALTTSKEKSASCPWDIKRDGFVMAEGAGILVLESEESAKKRNVPILGEIVSGGMSADAFHVTAPHPEGKGAALAMSLAIKHAGINKEDIDYINAHGTSTPLGDIAETKALKKVFEDHAYKLKVNSTKSMLGHLLGAAAAVEAIVCVKSLQTGILHPTINLNNPDPECDLNYVPLKRISENIRYALNNSFGFGGHNCSLIFKKYD